MSQQFLCKVHQKKKKNGRNYLILYRIDKKSIFLYNDYIIIMYIS